MEITDCAIVIVMMRQLSSHNSRSLAAATTRRKPCRSGTGNGDRAAVRRHSRPRSIRKSLVEM